MPVKKNHREFNIETWKRKNHFHFFKNLQHTHYSITTNLDVTELKKFTSANKISFYQSMIYLSLLAAQENLEFRLRIRGEKVIEHINVGASFTILNDNETFSLGLVPFESNFEKFCQLMKEKIEQVNEISKSEGNNLAPLLIKVNSEYDDDVIYISSTPWFHFTSITNCYDGPGDSIPRLMWGKFETCPSTKKILLPYSIQVNHALVDGLHIAKFLDSLTHHLNLLCRSSNSSC
jgi:chloramphenicol O-acetyltransferase type A